MSRNYFKVMTKMKVSTCCYMYISSIHIQILSILFQNYNRLTAKDTCYMKCFLHIEDTSLLLSCQKSLIFEI